MQYGEQSTFVTRTGCFRLQKDDSHILWFCFFTKTKQILAYNTKKKKQSHFNAAEIQVSLVRRIKELQQPCLSITWCGNCCITFLAVRPKRISPNYSYHHNIFYKIPFEINVVDPEIPVSFSVKISFRSKVDGASCPTQTRNFSSTVWLLSSDSSWFWLTLQESDAKATVITVCWQAVFFWGRSFRGNDVPTRLSIGGAKHLKCSQTATKRWQPQGTSSILYYQ